MIKLLKDKWNSQIFCWSCGQPEWFCNARHFWVPIFQGILIGTLIGGSIGAILAWIYNT